jgi:hypothetical protein
MKAGRDYPRFKAPLAISLVIALAALALFFTAYGVLVSSRVEGSGASATILCSYFTGTNVSHVYYWRRWRDGCPLVHEFEYNPVLSHWRVNNWQEEPIGATDKPRIKISP